MCFSTLLQELEEDCLSRYSHGESINASTDHVYPTGYTDRPCMNRLQGDSLFATPAVILIRFTPGNSGIVFRKRSTYLPDHGLLCNMFPTISLFILWWTHWQKHHENNVQEKHRSRVLCYGPTYLHCGYACEDMCCGGFFFKGSRYTYNDLYKGSCNIDRTLNRHRWTSRIDSGFEKTMVKELGKLLSYLRKKGDRFGDTKMGVTTFY